MSSCFTTNIINHFTLMNQKIYFWIKKVIFGVKKIFSIRKLFLIRQKNLSFYQSVIFLLVKQKSTSYLIIKILFFNNQKSSFKKLLLINNQKSSIKNPFYLITKTFTFNKFSHLIKKTLEQHKKLLNKTLI